MATTAQTLSGPWAVNVRGFLLMIPASTVLILFQENATQAPNGSWIALSILFQTLASGVWAFLVAAIARRITGRVPPVALVILWTGFGVTRGIVGGAVAATTGADPEWFYRIAFWTGLSFIWMPLMSYCLAKWEEYRELDARLAALGGELAEAERRRDETEEARARRLAAAIDDAIGPALEETSALLRSSDVDSESLSRIRTRLEELSERARSLATPTGAAPSGTPPRPSLVRAAVDFERKRPVFAGVLTAIVIAPFLIPDAYRGGGWNYVGEIVVAILVASATHIALSFAIGKARGTALRRIAAHRAATLLAGAAGGVTTLVLPWYPDLYFTPVALLSLLFMTAAALMSSAVALGITTPDLELTVAQRAAQVEEIESESRRADERVAARELTLISGPLSGRLASCAMALAFLADAGRDEDERARILAGVVAQVEIAARELRVAASG